MLRVNAPQVTHETIDGEVVIINLDTGSYYSMSGTGAAAWGLIDGGASIDAAAQALALQYSGQLDEIQSALVELATALQAEGLIIPDAVTRAHADPPTEPMTVAGERPPFVPPTVQKYTDMQDLLLLDPIHEVAESGWPHKE